MSRKTKIYLVCTIILLVLLAIIVFMLSRHGSENYHEYESSTVKVLEINTRADISVSLIKEGFDEDAVVSYMEYDFSTSDYNSERVKANAPDWIQSEYIFYPDTNDLLLRAYYAANETIGVRTFERSDTTSKFIYTKNPIAIYDVNTVPYVFVFSNHNDYVYIYALDDEIVEK